MEPAAPFLPYFGDDVERVRRLGAPHVQRTHRHDVTGKNTYAFNSLGFRGTEYAPDAARKVFVFGESYAFGAGLELEDSWPVQFVGRWAAAEGVDPAEVCIMNFAEGGASNDLIARLALSQCGVVAPDLILVNFAEIARVEGTAGPRPFKVGPWLTREDTKREVDAMAPSELRDTLLDRIRRAEGYYQFACDHTAMLSTLRNILLVQLFAASRGIRAVAVFNEMNRLRAMLADGASDALQRLAAQLDGSFLCEFTMACVNGREVPKEPRLDGLHHGPERHRMFAEEMWGFYRGGQ